MAGCQSGTSIITHSLSARHNDFRRYCRNCSVPNTLLTPLCPSFFFIQALSYPESPRCPPFPPSATTAANTKSPNSSRPSSSLPVRSEASQIPLRHLISTTSAPRDTFPRITIRTPSSHPFPSILPLFPSNAPFLVFLQA